MATKMKVRERALNDSCHYFPIYTYNPTTKVTKLSTPGDTGSTTIFRGRQFTASEGHRKNRKSGNYVEGGPFYTIRCVPDFQWVYANIQRKRPNGEIEKIFSPISVPHFPVIVPETGIPKYGSFKDLDPWGARAIAYSDPNRPNAELGAALGEIAKDKKVPIPGIQGWRRRTEIAKAAGSEYLNAVFGWLPLVRDILDTFDSIQGYNNILHNFHYNSGKDERREFAFDKVIQESETVTSTKAHAKTGGGTGFWDDSLPGTSTIHVETTIDRWFSGSFTYHAGEADRISKMLGIGSNLERLFGLSLNPDVLWELAPWSWAIDWFSDASEVIHNFTSMELGDSVMRYGFIMEEISRKEFYNLDYHGLKKDCGFNSPIPTSTNEITLKRRTEANPFGFGVEWSGLSPTQLAITAALGITRLR